MSNLNELKQEEGFEIIELTPPAGLDVEQQDLLHEQGVVGPTNDEDDQHERRLAHVEARRTLADLRATLGAVRRSAESAKQVALIEAQQKVHTALMEFEAATGHKVRYVTVSRDIKGTLPWPYREAPEADANPYLGMIYRIELSLEPLPQPQDQAED